MRIDNLYFWFKGGYLAWLIGVLGGALLIYSFYKGRSFSRADGSRKKLLLALRGASLIIILIILLQPVIFIKGEKNVKPLLAVLIDNSASMDLKDNGRSRAEIIKNVPIPSAEDFSVKYYAFSEGLKEVRGDRGDLPVMGRGKTDIGGAISEVISGSGPEKANAVMVFSDGESNWGRDPLLIAKMASAEGVPIYAVGVG
jgi:hypothetical protein